MNRRIAIKVINRRQRNGAPYPVHTQRRAVNRVLKHCYSPEEIVFKTLYKAMAKAEGK